MSSPTDKEEPTGTYKRYLDNRKRPDREPAKPGSTWELFEKSRLARAAAEREKQKAEDPNPEISPGVRSGSSSTGAVQGDKILCVVRPKKAKVAAEGLSLEIPEADSEVRGGKIQSPKTSRSKGKAAVGQPATRTKSSPRKPKATPEYFDFDIPRAPSPTSSTTAMYDFQEEAGHKVKTKSKGKAPEIQKPTPVKIRGRDARRPVSPAWSTSAVEGEARTDPDAEVPKSPSPTSSTEAVHDHVYRARPGATSDTELPSPASGTRVLQGDVRQRPKGPREPSKRASQGDVRSKTNRQKMPSRAGGGASTSDDVELDQVRPKGPREPKPSAEKTVTANPDGRRTVRFAEPEAASMVATPQIARASTESEGCCGVLGCSCAK